MNILWWNLHSLACVQFKWQSIFNKHFCIENNFQLKTWKSFPIEHVFLSKSIVLKTKSSFCTNKVYINLLCVMTEENYISPIGIF
jgi:hypothetical protein